LVEQQLLLRGSFFHSDKISIIGLFVNTNKENPLAPLLLCRWALYST
jgi:hypothetical protein